MENDKRTGIEARCQKVHLRNGTEKSSGSRSGMMFDRRLIKNFDWVLLLLTLAMIGVGLINLYSATSSQEGHQVFYRQLLWVCVGFGLLFVSLFFNYHRLEKYAFHFYAVGLILLTVVLFLGQTISGSKRWLVLGPLSFQPSEITKLIIIIVLARLFYQRPFKKPLGFFDLFFPALLVGVPFLLVLKEPDLGTALMIAFVAGSMILFVGVRLRTLVTMVGSVVFFTPLVWNFLKDYQKQRIITFLHPEQDPLGSGYHILQSKIAVGSGQWAGKGFMQSTQSHLHFLPEHHTDFAFSVLAEEWGFLGALITILLLLVIMLWGLLVARSSKDMFGSLVALGIVSMFFWQSVINICMVTGMLPVVGMPLPFISYGGSSIITNMLALGLLLNVSMRRFLFK